MLIMPRNCIDFCLFCLCVLFLVPLVDPTAGISQYNPIQLAKYCNLIGWSRATELDYIVKCPQCPHLLLHLPHFHIHNLGLTVLWPHFSLNPSHRCNHIIVHFIWLACTTSSCTSSALSENSWCYKSIIFGQWDGEKFYIVVRLPEVLADFNCRILSLLLLVLTLTLPYLHTSVVGVDVAHTAPFCLHLGLETAFSAATTSWWNTGGVVEPFPLPVPIPPILQYQFLFIPLQLLQVQCPSFWLYASITLTHYFLAPTHCKSVIHLFHLFACHFATKVFASTLLLLLLYCNKTPIVAACI